MDTEVKTINEGLSAFLKASPTPFHAVRTMAEKLRASGFQELDESAHWQLEAGRSYFVSRNGSSLVAFHTGQGSLLETGIRMVGAHTDSPCLKVKPQPDSKSQGYAQLGVEVYGGVLQNPWFDRDLSIAGRVNYRDRKGEVRDALIDFQRPVAIIPSLAIHLDKDVNQNRSINAQKHLPPILLQLNGSENHDFRATLANELSAQDIGDVDTVLDYELCLYDVQPAAVVGLNEEFLAAARLDNLLSCYVGLNSLLNAGGRSASLLVCNDHEEVGSTSAVGAQGPFLEAVLERICEQLVSDGHRSENFRRLLDRSMMISADNAHGIHPNYADRHDAQHGPILNRGPVIKVNANQRYATSSETSSMFRNWCEQVNVPVQAFVVRSDLGCGSTIGPIVSAELGVRTLDIGVPTFAMHSIRELAGTRDVWYLSQVLTHYFQRQGASE